VIVDAAVHPLLPDEEWHARLPGPWRHQSRLLPLPFGKLYEPAFDEVADADRAGDPAWLAERVFGAGGADAAILAPLGRGLLPNPQHGAAVARAMNQWLADRWLDDGRWFGAIRLVPNDVRAAIEELEHWSGHPGFVQAAVPLRAFAPYGDERYFALWEAASELGLPILVQDDMASGAEFVRSPVGQPVHFAEQDATRSMLSVVHLTSLITGGVAARLPGLRFIFGDGGIDVAESLLWRVDNEWRAGRVEVPWLDGLPSGQARALARFVTEAQGCDAGTARVAGADTRLVFGSHRPYWDAVVDVPPGAGVRAENVLAITPRLRSQLGAASAG
jgi:uncharacterized protein